MATRVDAAAHAGDTVGRRQGQLKLGLHVHGLRTYDHCKNKFSMFSARPLVIVRAGSILRRAQPAGPLCLRLLGGHERVGSALRPLLVRGLFGSARAVREKYALYEQMIASKDAELQRVIADKDAELQRVIVRKDAELQRMIADKTTIARKDAELQRMIADKAVIIADKATTIANKAKLFAVSTSLVRCNLLQPSVAKTHSFFG